MKRFRNTATRGRGRLIALGGLDLGGGRGRRLGVGVVAAGALLALSLVAALSLRSDPARAAYPGQNGRIVCSGDRSVVLPRAPEPPDPGLASRREIYSVDPEAGDAAGVTLLTNNNWHDGTPRVSPDGNRVAFESYASGSSEAHVMNVDGSGIRRLSFRAGEDQDPDWSPDGTRIGWTIGRGNQFHVLRMNADGTDQRQLTVDPASNLRPAHTLDGTKMLYDTDPTGQRDIFRMEDPARGDQGPVTRLTDHPQNDFSAEWSPDNTKIVFYSLRDWRRGQEAANREIYVMNADGSDVTRLTDSPDDPNTRGVNEALDAFPQWSPDGTKIVFHSDRAGGDTEVYTMNADGTDVKRLTNNRGFDGNCDWAVPPRPAVVPPPRAPAPPRVGAANVPRACAARDFRAQITAVTDTSVRRVTVSLDGRRIRSTTAGSFRVRVPVRRLRAGRHRLTVVATDAAGNRTRHTFRFRVCPARRGPSFTG